MLLTAHCWDGQLVSYSQQDWGRLFIAGEVSQQQSRPQKVKWEKLGPNFVRHNALFSYLWNPYFCKNSQKLSNHFLNTQETAFYLYLQCGTTALLPGRCKSSWYNLDWFAFKSSVMTVRLMPQCRSLTTGLMHLTNNLTVEFISMAFTFTVKCTYSPAAILIPSWCTAVVVR